MSFHQSKKFRAKAAKAKGDRKRGQGGSSKPRTGLYPTLPDGDDSEVKLDPVLPKEEYESGAVEEVVEEACAAVNVNAVTSDQSTDDLNMPLDEIKHPLKNTWSFWMFTNEKKKWEDNLVKLTTFDTVEDYWCLYHWMKLPSELKFGQDYAVFKNDIRPMWEDAANRRGGRLLINFEKTQNIKLDTVWSYVILFLIGEKFVHSDAVCGAVVNVRTKSKIGIWMSDARNETGIYEVGQKLKEILPLEARVTFQIHNDTNASKMFTI